MHSVATSSSSPSLYFCKLIAYLKSIMDPPLITTSHSVGGRPAIDNDCPIQKEQIRHHLNYLRCHKVTWSDIAKEMQVSREWLRLWRRKNNYSDPFTKTIISDDELDVEVFQLQFLHYNRGEVFMQSLLEKKGIIITRERMRRSLVRVDPEGRKQRRMRTVPRVEYNVTGPHQLWHMDGTHKLRTWNLSIQGCIDEGTRLVTLLKCNDSNSADVNLVNFKAACDEYMVPSRLRTDKGGENVKVADFMLRVRGLGRNSVMTGKSTRTQRIKRLWGDVNREVVDLYK